MSQQIICSFPSCAATYNEKWLTTKDKKYYFCTKIHKYNMTKQFRLCKLCDNYTDSSENVCDDCINKCTSCVVCSKDLNLIDNKEFNKNTHICEKCVSDEFPEFIICSSVCYHRHKHIIEQNRIIEGGNRERYGCGCIFPVSNFYNCDICYVCRFCSYLCLREHYIAKDSIGTYTQEHRKQICMSRECRVLLKFLPTNYKCEMGCCIFCSKLCALKYIKESRNCPTCGCCNFGNFCDQCTQKYCVVCREEPKEKCEFKGRNCNRYLCRKERCITKHHNMHKLYTVDMCENRGCYRPNYTQYKCRCGLKYCSLECMKKNIKNECAKCGCSHNTTLCYSENCNVTVCGTCSRHCDDCAKKLDEC